MVASAVFVAWTTVRTDTAVPPRLHAAAQAAARALATIPVVPGRPDRPDYQRSAFGTAWADAVSVTDGRNGCDTRNDILARDLTDIRRGPVTSCPRAVLTGELRSPYTGRFVVFRRDRAAGAVQIDHIVPLAYAWDLGAWSWPPDRRQNFANDPANLVAVDAASNQDKSDAGPGEWMPPERNFHCQYAIQFVAITRGYGLAVDEPSRRILAGTLAGC
ncbi:HNH endonuclease family protein [Gordonia sinesedis]